MLGVPSWFQLIQMTSAIYVGDRFNITANEGESPPPFTPPLTHPPPLCFRQTDVVILLQLYQTSTNSYEKERIFIERVAMTFGVSVNTQQSRVTMVTDNNINQHIIRINATSDLKTFIDDLDTLVLDVSVRTLSENLQKARGLFMNENEKEYNSVPRLLILVADDPRLPQNELESMSGVLDDLKTSSVTLIVVGTATEPSGTPLEIISGSSSNVFLILSIEEEVVLRNLTDRFCRVGPPGLEPAPPPSPKRITCDRNMDVLFLLDTSNKNTDKQYENSDRQYENYDMSTNNDNDLHDKERDFLKSLSAVFGISNDVTRIGVVTSYDFKNPVIKLNDHFNITSFNKHIDLIPMVPSKVDDVPITQPDVDINSTSMQNFDANHLTPPTVGFKPTSLPHGDVTSPPNVGIEDVLRKSIEILFNVKYGARQNTPKFLIYITDNSERHNEIVSESFMNETRDTGVNIICIGVGRHYNVNLLDTLSLDKSNVYALESFGEFDNGHFYEEVMVKYCEGGPCVKSLCQLTTYTSCPPTPRGCGMINNTSCTHLPHGRHTNPQCAHDACVTITASGEWQHVCGGVQAFDVIGPCDVILSSDVIGGQMYERVFKQGFHGVRGLEENGTEYVVGAVKLVCADTNKMMMMGAMQMRAKGKEKESYTRNAGVVLSVGFVALIGSGFL